jgi:hypothetical protein
VSLTELTRTDREVRQRFKEVNVKPNIIKGPRLVERTGNRHNVTGIAFDYLLRFELERRHAHLKPEASSWVAEVAVKYGRYRNKKSKAFLAQARELHQAYLGGEACLPELSRCCTVLAKLDLIYRAGWVDPDLWTPLEGMAAELEALLAVVPFEQLTPKTRLLTNPHFGEASRAVGGADADLILDHRLIDIKTTSEAVVSLDELRQLLGYCLLWSFDGAYTGQAAHELHYHPVQLSSVGIYYARYGRLYEFNLGELLVPGTWPTLRRWFGDRCELNATELVWPEQRSRLAMEAWLEESVDQMKAVALETGPSGPWL